MKKITKCPFCRVKLQKKEDRYMNNWDLQCPVCEFAPYYWKSCFVHEFCDQEKAGERLNQLTEQIKKCMKQYELRWEMDEWNKSFEND